MSDFLYWSLFALAVVLSLGVCFLPISYEDEWGDEE